MKKLSIIGLSLFICIFFVACVSSISEDLIEESTSPQGTYTLTAYRVNAGATVDFSVKVYITKDNGKETKDLIYNKYHDQDAKIRWLSESRVTINEITLDLSKNETYDWRN